MAIARNSANVSTLFRDTNSGGGRDNGDIRRVQDASDIVRIVGEHVALKPKGREFVGLCPFHDDHKPSMGVVPHKQIFHCFVCGSGGDVFSFVRKFHGMEFREALEYLAERAGIELTPWRPTGGRGAISGGSGESWGGSGESGGSEHGGESDAPGLSKQDLIRANSTALDFFRTILRHPEHGKAARELIERRRISPEMVERFEIGAAPERWDGLVRTLESKSLPMNAFEQLGLVKQRETGGGVYDALRHRLIFPIHDQGGRTIAFGGRRINDADEPKYINSPDTRLFNKSRTLYGLDLASREIQRRGTAIVCEGYMDVVACHQAGVTNAIGVLGTALTREHAAVLRRLCHTIVLLFDGDDAGQRAADRSIDVFFAEDLDVKVATLSSVTDAKDPDELLKREGGVALFDQAIGSAKDIMEYRYRRLAARLKDAGPAAMSRAVEEDLRHLTGLGLMAVKPVRRQLILKSLARITRVNVEAIVASIPVGRSDARRTGVGPGTENTSARTADEQSGVGSDPSADAAALGRGPLTPAEHVLGCLLCLPELAATLTPEQRDAVAAGGYRSALVEQVGQTVLEIARCGEQPGLARVLSALGATDGGEFAQSVAVALATRIDRESEENLERIRDHWTQCLVRLALDAASSASSKNTDTGPKPVQTGSGAGIGTGTGTGTGTGANVDDWTSLQHRMEQKRREHSTLGADRRTLPRPR